MKFTSLLSPHFGIRPFEFRAGMLVEIVSKGRHLEDTPGFQNSWDSDMNDYVGDGNWYTVEFANDSGVFLPDAGGFYYPPGCLALVSC